MTWRSGLIIATGVLAGILVGALLVFSVWQRKPPGRSNASYSTVQVKDLREFDRVHPNASQNAREHFYQGLVDHMNRDFTSAELSYQAVLGEIPDESVTLHNLKVLRRDREGG